MRRSSVTIGCRRSIFWSFSSAYITVKNIYFNFETMKNSFIWHESTGKTLVKVFKNLFAKVIKSKLDGGLHPNPQRVIESSWINSSRCQNTRVFALNMEETEILDFHVPRTTFALRSRTRFRSSTRLDLLCNYDTKIKQNKKLIKFAHRTSHGLSNDALWYAITLEGWSGNIFWWLTPPLSAASRKSSAP